MLQQPQRLHQADDRNMRDGLLVRLYEEGNDRDGICVRRARCPGYVRTPLVEKQIADQARTRGISTEEVIEKVMLAPAAIKRMIEPEEVAELTCYLCSDAARSVTGVSWEIDLGWTAQ
jgi:3-hydroxybutyrate dehydrogenase